MDGYCYNSVAAGRYAREEGEREARAMAIEALQESLFEEVKTAAQAHPLLAEFVDEACDALYAFLEREAAELLSSENI